MSRTSRRLKFDYYGRSLSNARVYRTEQNSISYSFSSITNITALCLYLFEAYSIKSNKFLKNYFRSTEQKPPKDDMFRLNFLLGVLILCIPLAKNSNKLFIFVGKCWGVSILFCFVCLSVIVIVDLYKVTTCRKRMGTVWAARADLSATRAPVAIRITSTVWCCIRSTELPIGWYLPPVAKGDSRPPPAPYQSPPWQLYSPPVPQRTSAAFNTRPQRHPTIWWI